MKKLAIAVRLAFLCSAAPWVLFAAAIIMPAQLHAQVGDVNRARHELKCKKLADPLSTVLLSDAGRQTETVIQTLKFQLVLGCMQVPWSEPFSECAMAARDTEEIMTCEQLRTAPPPTEEFFPSCDDAANYVLMIFTAKAKETVNATYPVTVGPSLWRRTRGACLEERWNNGQRKCVLERSYNDLSRLQVVSGLPEACRHIKAEPPKGAPNDLRRSAS